MRRLSRRFRPLFMFAVSGTLALFIDIGVLALCEPVWGLYGGRLCSFLTAATFTWLFNRSLTFKGPKPHGIVKEYLVYLSSMALGGAVNYLVYVASVTWIDAVHRHPSLGVALGSLAGLALNFLSARRIMQGRPS